MKELTLDDFKTLRRLDEQHVCRQLLEWKDYAKTDLVELVYNVWLGHFFKSRESYFHNPAFNYELTIRDVLEKMGFKVQRTSIIDWLADKEDTHWAVECKNASSRNVIFEGIAHLLYFRWRTNSQRKLVLFVNSKKVEESLGEFALHLGVFVQTHHVENPAEHVINRLVSHFEGMGVPKNEIIDRVKEVLPFCEDYVRTKVPPRIKRKYIRTKEYERKKF